MTRLWSEGSPITVTADDAGRPLRFIWQGRSHLVNEVTRRWRVNLDWWRQRTWRDYFKLTTESGLLVIVYHDLQEHQWYLQRLYD